MLALRKVPWDLAVHIGRSTPKECTIKARRFSFQERLVYIITTVVHPWTMANYIRIGTHAFVFCTFHRPRPRKSGLHRQKPTLFVSLSLKASKRSIMHIHRLFSLLLYVYSISDLCFSWSWHGGPPHASITLSHTYTVPTLLWLTECAEREGISVRSMYVPYCRIILSRAHPLCYFLGSSNSNGWKEAKGRSCLCCVCTRTGGAKARPPWADGRAPLLAATDDTLLAPNAQKS